MVQYPTYLSTLPDVTKLDQPYAPAFYAERLIAPGGAVVLRIWSVAGELVEQMAVGYLPTRHPERMRLRLQ